MPKDLLEKVFVGVNRFVLATSHEANLENSIFVTSDKVVERGFEIIVKQDDLIDQSDLVKLLDLAVRERASWVHASIDKIDRERYLITIDIGPFNSGHIPDVAASGFGKRRAVIVE